MHIRIPSDISWLIKSNFIFSFILPSERSFSMSAQLADALCKTCKESSQTPDEMKTCFPMFCVNPTTSMNPNTTTTTTEPK